MSNDKPNYFICPHCQKQVAEPYINCPNCFETFKEIQRLETSSFRNLIFGLSVLATGLCIGLTLGNDSMMAVVSAIIIVIGAVFMIKASVKHFKAQFKRDFLHINKLE